MATLSARVVLRKAVSCEAQPDLCARRTSWPHLRGPWQAVGTEGWAFGHTARANRPPAEKGLLPLLDENPVAPERQVVVSTKAHRPVPLRLRLLPNLPFETLLSGLSCLIPSNMFIISPNIPLKMRTTWTFSPSHSFRANRLLLWFFVPSSLEFEIHSHFWCQSSYLRFFSSVRDVLCFRS